MGRQKMGYYIVLMMSISTSNLIGRDNGILPRTTLQSCDYWASPDDIALQVGKVVLQFSENPMVHPLPSTIYSKKNDHIFFIPADISHEKLRGIQDSVKKNNNKWFSISISLESKPIAGIKVVFTCDAEKVIIEHIKCLTR